MSVAKLELNFNSPVLNPFLKLGEAGTLTEIEEETETGEDERSQRSFHSKSPNDFGEKTQMDSVESTAASASASDIEPKQEKTLFTPSHLKSRGTKVTRPVSKLSNLTEKTSRVSPQTMPAQEQGRACGKTSGHTKKHQRKNPERERGASTVEETNKTRVKPKGSASSTVLEVSGEGSNKREDPLSSCREFDFRSGLKMRLDLLRNIKEFEFCLGPNAFKEKSSDRLKGLIREFEFKVLAI